MPKDSTSIAASLPPVFRKPFGIMHQLRSLSRLTLVRTPDEMQVTMALHKALEPKFDRNMWLWHPRIGVRHMRKEKPTSTPLNAFYEDIRAAGGFDSARHQPPETLAFWLGQFLTRDPRDEEYFMVALDPTFTQEVERILVDFANHSTRDNRYVAMIVFVCPPGTEIPERLRPFINVVDDDQPFEPEAVARHIEGIFTQLRISENKKRVEHFAELMARHVKTTFEIDNLVSSAVIRVKELAQEKGDSFREGLDNPLFDKSLEEVIKARYGTPD